MSARLIPPPQLHLHRITQYSQEKTDTNLLRAPSELSVDRTKSSVRTVLGRALVRRWKQRCASYTNTAVLYSRISLNRTESTALVIWGACRIRDPALGHAAKYCLSRTELNCQRPLTRSRLNVWCHARHNSHRNWPWTAPVSG